MVHWKEILLRKTLHSTVSRVPRTQRSAHTSRRVRYFRLRHVLSEVSVFSQSRKWEDFTVMLLIEKNYPHHGAVAFGHFGKTLYEVFKYVGVPIEEIDFNQPKGMLYPTENPFA